jgi:hypothetical protein
MTIVNEWHKKLEGSEKLHTTDWIGACVERFIRVARMLQMDSLYLMIFIMPDFLAVVNISLKKMNRRTSFSNNNQDFGFWVKRDKSFTKSEISSISSIITRSQYNNHNNGR